MDTKQLVTLTEFADMKDMSRSLLHHHLKKPGAPKPVNELGKRVYKRAEAESWEPVKLRRGRKKAAADPA